MPRYEYRKLEQLPDATKAFDAWIDHLDREFANKDVTHRSEVVRNTLHEIYLAARMIAATRREPVRAVADPYL